MHTTALGKDYEFPSISNADIANAIKDIFKIEFPSISECLEW